MAMNSEAPGFSEVFVCLKPRIILSTVPAVWEKNCSELLVPAFFFPFLFFPQTTPTSLLRFSVAIRAPLLLALRYSSSTKKPALSSGYILMHMHTVGFSSAAHGNKGPLRRCAQWGEALMSSQHNMASPCRWIARLLSAASTVHLNLFWEGSNSTALQISPSSRRRHTVNK